MTLHVVFAALGTNPLATSAAGYAPVMPTFAGLLTEEDLQALVDPDNVGDIGDEGRSTPWTPRVDDATRLRD